MQACTAVAYKRNKHLRCSMKERDRNEMPKKVQALRVNWKSLEQKPSTAQTGSRLLPLIGAPLSPEHKPGAF